MKLLDSWRACLLLLAAAFFFLGSGPVSAQEPPKAPVWTYAFDLSCRKFGEAQFTKDTKKFGLEVFQDANNGFGVYISQIGDISIAPQFQAAAPIKDSQAPTWTAGLDLKARQAGEKEFTDKTRTYALEVFFDTNTKHWIYITENGHIAVTPTTGKLTQPEKLKAPEWLHSFDLKVRKGGERMWTKDVKAYGIEVYRDNNNDNLIYICETGAIAVLPAAASSGSGGKDPEWLHGQDLQCRKFGERDFTGDTRKYGVEIFRDANNGNLLFLCETGALTVIPGSNDLKAPTVQPSDARFTHGLDLSCRPAGERDFTTKTPTFALEVYQEGNVQATLYLAETGAVAAARNKK